MGKPRRPPRKAVNSHVGSTALHRGRPGCIGGSAGGGAGWLWLLDCRERKGREEKKVDEEEAKMGSMTPADGTMAEVSGVLGIFLAQGRV